MPDKEHWLANLLINLKADDSEYKGKTPEEIIKAASWKAFTISTASGLAPGPAGWITILPEIISVTKIQINMIYGIACYFDKKTKFNSTTVLLIFANEVGIAARSVIQQTGGKLIIRAMSSKAMHAIAHRVSARIAGQITQKAIGRWIPFVLAPVFGAFSRSMTKKIGSEAIKLFSSDFEIIQTALCPNGHELNADMKFCPQCGLAK